MQQQKLSSKYVSRLWWWWCGPIMIIVRIWRIHSVAAPDDISLVTALLITNACIVQSGIIQPEMEELSNILTRLCNEIGQPSLFWFLITAVELGKRDNTFQDSEDKHEVISWWQNKRQQPISCQISLLSPSPTTRMILQYLFTQEWLRPC